jgi:hypothetical protein
MNRTSCKRLLAGGTLFLPSNQCNAIFSAACNFQRFELFKMYNKEIGKFLGAPRLDPLKFGGNAFVRLALSNAGEARACR